MRKAVRALLAAVVAGLVVMLFVVPARTWMEQSRSMSQAQHRLAVLSTENTTLAKRAAQLQSSAYIEQLARSEYGLAFRGEQSYSILPPAESATTLAPASRK